LCDENKKLVGIVFQDGIMKSVFATFPEVILVDATYKLTELRMPVYLMMVVVGNGQSEIVCTVLETEESMRKMIQVFKSHNLAWSSSRVLISDKDCIEKAVFTKKFPGISLQLCLFHVLRRFRQEFTCDKMGIRAGERDHALEILLKLAYFRSESDYSQHYEVRKHAIQYTFVMTGTYEPRSNKGDETYATCLVPSQSKFIKIHRQSPINSFHIWKVYCLINETVLQKPLKMCNIILIVMEPSCMLLCCS